MVSCPGGRCNFLNYDLREGRFLSRDVSLSSTKARSMRYHPVWRFNVVTTVCSLVL